MGNPPFLQFPTPPKSKHNLLGSPTSLTCPRPRKSKPIVPGSSISLTCPMPRKSKPKVAAKRKVSGVRYWAQIRYRNESTQWKWYTRWTIRTRPSPMCERCEKKLSKARLESWQSSHLTDVYIEEVLGVRMNAYLHSCPGIAS